MININYRQIDLVNKGIELDDIAILRQQKFYIIGVEVTDVDIAKECDINIDPQHGDNNGGQTTAIETIFKLRDLIFQKTPRKNIIILTIKSDVDSISSIALITMILRNEFEITNDLILRLSAIALSDKHGRADFNTLPKITHPGYSIYGLPIALYGVVGDRHTDISKKVSLMIEYLKTGNIESQDRITKNELIKKENAIKNIKYNIIIPNTLVYVESNQRGAIGFGYKHAKIVIAKNNSFHFSSYGENGNHIIGTKYTIAQYNDSFINMTELLKLLQKTEPGWGGSNVIIGSPQDGPSNLASNEIIDVVKEYITSSRLRTGN